MSDEEQQAKYLACNGAKCPHCGSEQIEGRSVEINAGSAYQNIDCNDCGASWVDCYTLVSFDNLETP